MITNEKIDDQFVEMVNDTINKTMNDGYKLGQELIINTFYSYLEKYDKKYYSKNDLLTLLKVFKEQPQLIVK